MLMQMMVDKKILEYKLDTIRTFIRDCLNKSEELDYILSIIERYEHLPFNWELDEPFVKQDTMR